MKNQHLNGTGKQTISTMKKMGMLVLAASLFYASCKKGSESSIPAADAVVVAEAGDNDSGLKNGASVSATPTGPATLAVYPVRGEHNTGYDSASGCAPSSWNCNSTYSNSDYVGGDHYGIDIWGDLNVPIAATVTGVITFKGFDSGLGNTVVIREPSGWHHWLGHMNYIASGIPAVGSTITAGTIVGGMGHTGSNSNGVTHLHMSVNHGHGVWSTGQNFWSIMRAKESNVCGPGYTFTQPIANGKYKITSRLSAQKGITVSGASTANLASVISWDYTAAPTASNDEWNVTKLGNGYYRLIAAHSGKDAVIENASYSNSAQAVQYSYTSDTSYNDEWFIMGVGSGYYKIVNRRSQLALNIQGGSTANGAFIIQYPYAGSPNSDWLFTIVP